MYLISVFIYLGILIGIGWYWSRFARTQDDFMVAGRNLSAKVLVGTLLATWMGSGSIIGGAGLAYTHGFASLWFNAGVWIAIILLAVIAPRARALEQYTIPDLLEIRYSRHTRILGTIITVIAYTAIASYQFKAGGMVLNVLTGIPSGTGIIITALFVIFYTALAGLISVAYTDVANGIVMTVGFVLVLPFLLDTAGGWNAVATTLPPDRFEVFGKLSPAEAIGFALPTLLLILGEANIYQRFFAAKDAATARRSVYGWMAGTIFLETIIVVVAVIGSACYAGINPEQIIVHSVNHGIPPAIGIVLLAAIVAVIISTADSFLLISATNIVRDFQVFFPGRGTTARHPILMLRSMVVLLGLFALFQSWLFPTVLEMAIYAYTIYGAGITPLLLGAFFWKRGNEKGASAALIGGTLVTLVHSSSGLFPDVPLVYPALAVALILFFTVSYIAAPPKREQLSPFFDRK